MLRLKFLEDFEIALNIKENIATALKWHGNSAIWKEKILHVRFNF